MTRVQRCVRCGMHVQVLLTTDEQAQIGEMYRAGRSHKEIASRFNVTVGHVAAVRARLGIAAARNPHGRVGLWMWGA